MQRCLGKFRLGRGSIASPMFAYEEGPNPEALVALQQRNSWMTPSTRCLEFDNQ
jgi:hypothetical protein